MSQILLSWAPCTRAEAAAGFGPMEVADGLDDSVLQSAQWARDKFGGRPHTYHVQSPGFSPRESGSRQIEEERGRGRDSDGQGETCCRRGA